MAVQNYLHSAFEYNLKNGLVQTLGWHAASYQRCRYEDFVANPEIIKCLLQNIGIDCTHLTIPTEMRGDQVHAIHVNPMLFQQGTIKLRADNEWQGAMSRTHKFQVSVLTLPWLLHFGYDPLV
jgi:hypothetical protein